MIRASGGSKSRLVKAAGAESCGQRRNQKLCAAVARSTFPSEKLKFEGIPSTTRKVGLHHTNKIKSKSTKTFLT